MYTQANLSIAIMSDAEAVAKPVEAVEAVEAQPTEEKQPEQTETAQTETKDEKPAEDGAAAQEPKILKTTAQIDNKDFRNNRKFDPSAREVTDDPVAIRKQVEFYFGDWNFPQDKFMWETAGGAENKPVPVKTIHSFKRMRTFQPYSAVIAALRDSTFLEVSGEEGEEVVKRKNPYKPLPANKAKAEAATVYVKGFGDEAPDTQFELEGFFAKFGDVKAVKLRRTNENLFKGSVFVTFADEETAKNFLKQDPAPKWKENDLKIMSKHDYCEEKSDLIRQGKIEPSNSNPKKFYEGRDSGAKGARGRGRGGFNGSSDDWKKRRDHDQKNGFRDRRGGGRGGGRGRGGRGRGGRDFRDRDNRRGDNQSEQKFSSNDAKPRIQSSTDGEDKTANKRSREEDGPTDGAPAAKKVDTKEEA
ncbi:La protein [Paramyrothecium foliicola]|nr:La protein [Paramyrothecium foliicola]